MRRVIILLLITTMAGSSWAQIRLDSTLSIWNNESLADTVRLKAMDGALRQLTMSLPPAESYAYAEAFIALAKKNARPMLEANGYMFYGQVASQLENKTALARSNFEKAMEIYQRLDFTFGIARAMSNLANTYRTEDPLKTINMSKDAIKLCIEAGEMRAAIGTSFNLSETYLRYGDNVKAFEAINQSVKWAEELDDKVFLQMAYHGLAHVYNAQGDLEKANDFHDKVLKLTRAIGDKSGELSMLSHIAQSYEHQGNMEQALYYAKKSYSLAKKEGLALGMLGSYFGLARLYIITDSLDLAKKYLEEANIVGDENFTNSFSHQFESICLKGQLKLKEGLFKEAATLCDKARILASENNQVREEKIACECLFEAYKKQKKGNEALEIQDRLQEIAKLAQNEEVALKLQQMEFAKQVYQDSVETFQKERQIELAHLEEMRAEEKTRNIGLGIGGLVLLIAGGLYSRLRYVRKSKAIIESERDRSENLLLNILPEEVAQELKEKGKADARDFDDVSILFTDFVSFTETAEKLSAAELVEEINECFEAFDHILENYNIEKIKTIGDAYMAAGGLPVPTPDSIKNTVLAALEMQNFIINRKTQLDAQSKPGFEMRVGIHTGPVVAGIVGVKKFQYDIWGDTVNTASRMESNGEPGRVNISHDTYSLLQTEGEFVFESRGKVKVKGKGEMEMYFVFFNNPDTNESNLMA